MTNEKRKYRRRTRRDILAKMAAGGALGVGGVLGLIREAMSSGTHPVKQGIHSIKGPVTIDGAPAAVGRQIRPGQVVATGPGGETVFVIGEDAFLQRENTAVGFDNNVGVAILRFISGKMLSVFGKGHKQLATPTASIGIRGTACYIEAEPARTYFCLCYGQAEVTPLADPAKKEIIRTRHHDHPIYIGARADALLMSAATVINHNDDELIMLENLAGRWPPFYGKSEWSY